MLHDVVDSCTCPEAVLAALAQHVDEIVTREHDRLRRKVPGLPVTVGDEVSTTLRHLAAGLVLTHAHRLLTEHPELGNEVRVLFDLTTACPHRRCEG